MSVIIEGLFTGPAGKPVVIQSGQISDLDEAMAAYVGTRAWVRFCEERRGGASRSDRRDARVLGEALAYHQGVTVFELQTMVRERVHEVFLMLQEAMSGDLEPAR